MDKNENYEEVEMPSPSYWPIVLAFSMLLMAVGIIYSLIISAVGFVLLLVALFSWTLENRTESLLREEVVVTDNSGTDAGRAEKPAREE